MKTLSTLAVCLAPIALSACSTSILPTAEQLKLKEFRENIAALDDDYMDGSDLPSAPTEVRTAAEWDAAARELEALGANFKLPETDDPMTDAEFQREFARLQALAVEYRKDDPQ